MKIIKTEDLAGSDQDGNSPDGWRSVRWLLKSDGMGFSFHETTFPAGLSQDMWYKNHLEAVFCFQGTGVLVNRDSGEQFDVMPGAVYALDNHDRHTLTAKTEMKFACVFNPPVSGREIHDADGSYEADIDP